VCHKQKIGWRVQQQQQPSLLVPRKLSRLEMKPHEQKKTGIKQCQKRKGKTKDDKNKNQSDKRRKDNKTLSKKKSEKRQEKNFDRKQ
jgi:hypothetical protein